MFFQEVTTMNVRDLVPWSRGDRERSPATRSDALRPVLSLHREMNRLFDDMFRGFDDSRLFAGRSGWPSMDVEETDKEYRVTAELPGLEERDVEVLLQDGLLTVRGKRSWNPRTAIAPTASGSTAASSARSRSIGMSMTAP